MRFLEAIRREPPRTKARRGRFVPTVERLEWRRLPSALAGPEPERPAPVPAAVAPVAPLAQPSGLRTVEEASRAGSAPAGQGLRQNAPDNSGDDGAPDDAPLSGAGEESEPFPTDPAASREGEESGDESEDGPAVEDFEDDDIYRVIPRQDQEAADLVSDDTGPGDAGGVGALAYLGQETAAVVLESPQGSGDRTEAVTIETGARHPRGSLTLTDAPKGPTFAFRAIRAPRGAAG